MSTTVFHSHSFCRHVHYVSKLPGSRQAFEEQLGQFYSQHGAVLSPPSILHVPLACYTIFNSVAERGGFEGVSGTRYMKLLALLCRDHNGNPITVRKVSFNTQQ